MKTTLAIALRATLVTLGMAGIIYPFAVTALAQVIFPHRANGSFVADEQGHEVGSELIGQAFASPAYIHSRPSANSYDATNSGGTNFGVTAQKERDAVGSAAADFQTDTGAAVVPVDAVTSSASGLDPDVSPDTARAQVARIAAARGVAPERIAAVVDAAVAERALGFIGEPHVNVLDVNLALDRKFGRPPSVATGATGATMAK